MRNSKVLRKTKETDIKLKIEIDGIGTSNINTGIPFLDHMLDLFSIHGFFNLDIKAKGDIDIDFHHTTEDIGIVLGSAIKNALGNKEKIKRYGYFTLPMDETLCSVSIDISNRPYLIFNVPEVKENNTFNIFLAKEFFIAFANNLGMNLHINVKYGENEHHIIESIFKAFARALDMATSFDERIIGVCSSKGIL